MGMTVVSTSGNRTVYQITNRDGSTAGTISVTKPAKKKAKRLNYNFKSISSQIMLSKTSNTAGKAITKARGTIASLLRKMGTGEYDDKEIEQAITHAKKMERIARKRVRHLKQEEEIRQKGSSKESNEDFTEELEEMEDERELEISEQEMRELLEEYQKMVQEAIEEQAEQAAPEQLEGAAAPVEMMDEEDLERIKKKHRSDEMREMADADMEYLRAFFNKLEKERQEVSSGAVDLSGVSLELSGLQMPVEAPQMPAEIQGGSVDLIL